MSVKPGSVATHIPPSLPSFAQTFSSASLTPYGPDDNSLPPIQSKTSSHNFSRVERPQMPVLSRHRGDEDAARSAGRKRSHEEASSSRNEDSQPNSGRNSPSLTRVKEEPEQDMLDPTPPPPPSAPENTILDTSVAPPPSSILPPPKKRRVTISGAPALDTDVRIAPDQTNSTPISPVVIGINVQRDNPSEVDKLRSMLSVKQQQQALIEQRRGSVAGLMSPTATSGEKPGSRPLRRSPNLGAGNRRHTIVAQKHGSPPPTSISAHSLPPPPISFARRPGGIKRKPADILISPRDAHTPEQFAPSIQSAPPIPHAGQQGGGTAGRFHMALPRLPSVMGIDNARRPVSGNVPPTPTRFSAQRMAVNQAGSHPIPGISGRSPPNASIAIASTLVPPTPSALHHPGYTGEKSAFLAPFESFYDALNDSRQLKTWLSEQLQKSKILVQNLTQQQDKLHEVVDSLVEKKVSGMRSEISSLHKRVEELEEALRVTASSRRPSLEGPGSSSGRSKGKQATRNGVAEGYTFPPIPPIDRERLRSESERRASPGWGHEKDNRDAQDSENGSPAPFSDSRRLSLSSSRLEPRSQPIDNVARPPFAMPSPPMTFRDGPTSTSHPPPLSSKLSRGGRPPGPPHQQSSPRLSGSTQDTIMAQSSPQPRRDDSRRNSIVDANMDNRES
ncbi:hypothetical protein D9757_003464 [Collybiopsis confluens]|uniref:Uncharacterized protein n=1 Tax=Collybiopsis confluens TaxID=2823264 RepID=A0A8H5HTM0_9AGAR|nr:hypothetical protein D9757_003464 [Collybiopsis confluens]